MGACAKSHPSLGSWLASLGGFQFVSLFCFVEEHHSPHHALLNSTTQENPERPANGKREMLKEEVAELHGDEMLLRSDQSDSENPLAHFGGGGGGGRVASGIV